MASVRIKFRPSTVEGKEGTLYFQIIHKRVARTVFTDCRVFPCEWDNVSSSVITRGTEERKAYLEMVVSKLKWSMERFTKIIAGKEKEKANYSVDDIVSEYNRQPDCPTFFTFIRSMIAKKTAAKRYGTAKTYRDALASFSNFRNGEDVPFDTRVWQEATTLAENGYTVSVICPTGKGYDKEYEYLKGVHIYRHKLPKEGNGALGYAREYLSALWAEYSLAKKVYSERGFHCIHGCNPPDDIWMVARMFKGKGVDYIFDHHDICPELFEAKFGHKSGLLYKSQLWLERQTYSHCKFAFVTNESYKKIAIERGGMKPEDVIVLRSGPKLERLRIVPAKPEIKRGRKFMVGYVGVISQQEGIEYLLKAARYIKEDLKRSDIFWGIVGGGPHLEQLRKLSSEMGLDDIVEFTGRVSDEKLLDYLNTADVCVNSDEYNAMNDKSTMNKILEYMALGKPIVQFDLTEGRYSAQKASLYAKPNDAKDMADKIIQLLENPEERKRMGELGRKRVLNELSWAHTSKALLEGYDNYFRKKGL